MEGGFAEHTDTGYVTHGSLMFQGACEPIFSSKLPAAKILIQMDYNKHKLGLSYSGQLTSYSTHSFPFLVVCLI